MSIVRCAVVHCPAWPLVAAVVHGQRGHGPVLHPDEPLVVLRSQRVLHCSARAWQDGVRIGQRRRQAQGACPHVIIVPDDCERDIRWFEPVARSIGELVPLVDLETPGSVLLATRGPSRYVGGDAALAVRLDELARAGVERICGDTAATDIVRVGGGFGVGIADGRLAAMLAARESAQRGEPVVVDPGGTADFLAPHSVSVLSAVAGCPVELVDLLQHLGLRRLADVAAVSPEHLFDRFAAMGTTLHRWVTGTDDTPPHAVPPPVDLSVVQSFDDPQVQLDRLIFAAKRLADDLAAHVQERGYVCTRLLVEAHTDHAETSQRSWYRPEGLGAGAILDRIRWQLDGWINGPEPLSAGVVLIRLTPTLVRHDTGVQEGFWGGRSQADENAARAVTRVIGLLGSHSVTMASWSGGRDPRQVYDLVPAAGSALDAAALDTQQPATSPPWPGSIPAPAPSLLHHDPEPLEVLDADGGTVAVDGRGLVTAAPATMIHHGRSYRVVAWAGPWPLDERWWEARAHRSARFQLVVERPEGPWACLVEITAGSWQMTAQYV